MKEKITHISCIILLFCLEYGQKGGMMDGSDGEREF